MAAKSESMRSTFTQAFPTSEPFTTNSITPAKPGTSRQEILAAAGAMLFRGAHIKKKIKVLSGGERARVCMTGLLLGSYNVLILDEPGNHLDVETIDALTEALDAYEGTVIFTSHDRHFLSKVATSIIEVRDGTARAYDGDYEAYLYYVNKEIDDGERERDAKRGKSSVPSGPMPVAKSKEQKQNETETS